MKRTVTRRRARRGGWGRRLAYCVVGPQVVILALLAAC